MSSSLCLRCDWRGTTSTQRCPQCGAIVFTSQAPPVDTRRGAGSSPGRAAPRPSPNSDTTPTVERSWRNWVAVAVIVTLAVGAVVFVQRHTPPSTTAGAADTGLRGYLLSSAREGDGVRLWIWDLAHATAAPGPMLEELPEELVYAYRADDTGWIGVTTLGDDGVRTASVIRYLGTTDHPIPVASGRLVAWVPGGSFVSVVRSVPVGGCHRRVSISTWFVTYRSESRRFSGVVCGDPTAFGRNDLASYLTIERAGVPTTLQVGNGELIPVLPGRRLLGISGQGELLVQATDTGSSLEVFHPAPLRARPRPVGRGADRLVPNRVLGWSPDGPQGFVLGTYRDVHGIFLADVASLSSSRRPQLVLPTAAIDVQVAPTTDGDLYVLTDGEVRLFHDGQVHPVAAPTGAPRPIGPLLWVSTLPYSPEQP